MLCKLLNFLQIAEQRSVNLGIGLVTVFFDRWQPIRRVVEPTSARTTKIHGGLVHPEGRHERLRNRCILGQS